MKLAALIFFASAVVISAAPVVTVTQNSASVGRYDIYELTMTNLATYANPWEDPVITAVFTAPSGTTNTVGGFYFATNTWKLRFAPRETGAWTWSLSYTDSSGMFQTTGGFTCTNSANSGFLRINPVNPYCFITEGNSNTFYAHGQNLGMPNNGGGTSVSLTNLSQHSFATDGYGQPTTIDQYLGNASRSGFNMLREMNNQDGFYQIDTTGGVFNVNGTGKNYYDLAQGQLCDQLMASVHAAGWKCLMTFWASPANFIPNYDLSNPMVAQACLHFHQYVINRYGAYVDLWELCNEKTGVPSNYCGTVTSYVRANDPYQHLVTINYAQWQNLFDVVTFHDYFNDPERSVAGSVASEITSFNSYRQPVIGGEVGQQAFSGAYDPLRFRMLDWVGFLQRCTMLYWAVSALPASGQSSSYQASGNANQSIGWEERAESKSLYDFLANFDPAATNINPTLSPGGQMFGYGLAGSNSLALYIVHGQTSLYAVISNATVTVNVPANNLQGEWFDPASGTIRKLFTVNAGSQALPIPSFTSDIALRLQPAVTTPVLQFSSSSYSTNANQSNATLTVYRLGSSSGAVCVNYTTSDGLAVAGTDYLPVSGTLCWNAGDVSPKTITVPLLYNGTVQANKDFLVSLSHPPVARRFARPTWRSW